MLCFDIYALSQAFGRFYNALLDPLGLTYPQYLVMSVLWTDETLSVGRIGARLGLETSTVTPLLKRLEAVGLVTRRRSSVDERRVEVDLTARGRAMAVDAAHIPACVEEAMGLSSDEVERLRGELMRLRRAFGSD